MLDFELAKKAFKDYLNNYNTDYGKIDLKVRHTYGVVESSEYISKDLKLSAEDIELSKLIALLHDIGRFEQLKRFDSFIDHETVDHAKLGVEILFENNLIRNFIKEDKYDQIIYKAIENHNKYKIEDGLSEKELLHAKVIRDADKTDNFRVKSESAIESMFGNESKKVIENDIISENIYNDFMNNKCILLTDRKTYMDFWVSYLAFIFDFNFNSGLSYIMEKNYINIMIDRIDYKVPDTILKMENIKKYAINYIDGRLSI